MRNYDAKSLQKNQVVQTQSKIKVPYMYRIFIWKLFLRKRSFLLKNAHEKIVLTFHRYC